MLGLGAAVGVAVTQGTAGSQRAKMAARHGQIEADIRDLRQHLLAGDARMERELQEVKAELGEASRGVNSSLSGARARLGDRLSAVQASLTSLREEVVRVEALGGWAVWMGGGQSDFLRARKGRYWASGMPAAGVRLHAPRRP